jgi:23S rRNA pseudouridine1911/1915/1917 synthase
MRILYEDRSLIAVYKEPGLAVQTKKVTEKDLESILLTCLAGEKRGSGRPELYVIHRIDQPVDGIVLFAKNKKAAADLTRQLTDGSMKKIYRAEVAGTIPSESGILEDFLVKDGRRNMSSVVQDPKSNPGAKRAKLSYRKIGENSLEIELFSGRHHQIRVQMANAGWPLFGDTKYNPAFYETQEYVQTALCAYRLSFIHPKTKKVMDFSIEPDNSLLKQS